MRLISNLFSSLFPGSVAAGSQSGVEREIDASTRFAVLGAIKGSVFWLLVASILGLMASIKLHSPSYLSDASALTYGRVYPAFWNALVYGWLFNAGIACVSWIVARLAGRAQSNGHLLAVFVGAWNVAVTIGIVGIFWGDQNPYSMLEFPAYTAPFLLVSFVGIGVWVALAFRARAFRSSFASQWHALAGVFAFVWIYTVAQTMIFVAPTGGVFEAVVAAWYRSNLFGLAVAPLAFATIYYLIPKALGQHVVGYRQSSLAFWSWIAFTSCSGLASLVNGPFPAWIASAGVVASFALLLPLMIFSMQFLSSLFVSFSKIWDTISIRYVFYGVVAFILATLLIVVGSLREVQDTIQFSHFDSGARFLFLAGFAGMVFMGGIYFMLPRLLRKPLPSPGLADFQFWILGLGIFAVSFSMVFGGVTFGSLLNNSSADTIRIVENAQAYLFMSTIGFVIFLCGSLAFAVSFFWMLASSRDEEEEATAELLKPAPELEYTAS